MRKSVTLFIACILCLSLAACTPNVTSDRNYTSVADTDEYVFEISGIDYESLSSGTGVGVYMENKTDSRLTFSVRDVAVNGKAVSASEEWDVAAKASSEDAFTVLQTELNENGITEFTEVEFTLIIKSSSETLLSKVFTYNVSEKTAE